MQMPQYFITYQGSNNGLDFHAICGLQTEPAPEKLNWIDNAVILKVKVSLTD